LIRSSPDRALLGASVLVAGACLVSVFASCAEAQNDGPSHPDASLSVTADAGDGGAEPVDGGCDPSDEDCVAHAISCDEAPWCPVPTNVSAFYALTAVWGSSKNDVWAAGSGGTIIHFDGTAWAPTPTAVKNTFHAIWGSSKNDVWVASATDTVFHSTGYAGAATEWQRVRTPLDDDTDAPLYTIWGTSADDVRIAGRSFVLRIEGTEDFINSNILTKTTLDDGGVAWQGTPGSASVLGLWGTSANDVWLVGDNSSYAPWQLGLTLHGTGGADGSITWTEVDSQSSVRLRAIWGSSANDIWAVGDIGTIRHIDGATSKAWDVIASPTTAALHAVWGSAADDIWAVGEAGTIIHYDGKAWTKTIAAFPVGKKPTLYGVWGSGRDDVWIVGNGVALHYTGGKLGDAGDSQ
jgi:hypothetical protein